jgi:2-keto-4-pentenoate hydratase/2-oxohepta-3-ene-1,7-dioic acid hydratase in catechol pathway
MSETVHEVNAVLPPLEPSAVFAIGLNYKAHAAETGMERPERPIVFMKAPSSIVAHNQLIVIPEVCQERPEVDFEGELAVVIGVPAKDVSVESALEHVLGYTIANDVSARRWQGKKGGGQWVRAKSFDTFCPLGPFLVSPKYAGDPTNMSITTKVNGVTMQSASTSDMIFSVAELISFLSQGTTLDVGTIILTGTPAGVGYTRDPPVYLRRGDTVDVSISGLGTLSNSVAEAGPNGELRL